jgi:outer membrane immunogenic protein
MKKVLCLLGATLLFAGPAFAADLAVKAPVAAVAPFSWTGFYIGAHVGAGWGTKEWDEFIPLGRAGKTELDSSHTVNGILGGGQIGYNWQFVPSWVLGIEAQLSAADLKGKGNCGAGIVEFEAAAFLFNCRSKVDAIGTFAARLGLPIVNNQGLIYVKGGAAWAHDKFNLDFDSRLSSSISDDRWGWMLGTGLEFLVPGAPSNWTAKIEYNYMDLGTKSYQFTNFDGFGNFDITQRLHLIKFGINYHFR